MGTWRSGLAQGSHKSLVLGSNPRVPILSFGETMIYAGYAFVNYVLGIFMAVMLSFGIQSRMKEKTSPGVIKAEIHSMIMDIYLPMIMGSGFFLAKMATQDSEEMLKIFSSCVIGALLIRSTANLIIKAVQAKGLSKLKEKI